MHDAWLVWVVLAVCLGDVTAKGRCVVTVVVVAVIVVGAVRIVGEVVVGGKVVVVDLFAVAMLGAVVVFGMFAVVIGVATVLVVGEVMFAAVVLGVFAFVLSLQFTAIELAQRHLNVFPEGTHDAPMSHGEDAQGPPSSQSAPL